MPKTISPTLFARWKSARQVGAAKPSLRVTVTRGLIDKHYAPFTKLDGSREPMPTIVKGNNAKPWQGFWRATGEPIEVPNVLSVKQTRALQQKGTGTATIEVENIIYKAIVGAGGTFHAILRGYLSPWLGLKLLARARIPSWVENEWFEVLDGGYRVDVYEGYGDQQVHTFCGFIENSDFETTPDRITITARDPGVLFTDQRVMGWNKAPEIRAPLQIADRERTLGVKPVSFGAKASSTASGRHAASVVSRGNRTPWVSAGHPDSTGVEWIEVSLPPGYYEKFYTVTPYAGQSMWVSVHATKGSKFDGAPVEGWIGELVTPGEGSVAALRKWGSTSASGATRGFGGSLQLAPGSKMRITLSHLPYRSEWHDHRAGMTRLAAFLFGTDPQHPLNGDPGVSAKHWLLVDDLADIARQVFMWMGFHEWDIENLGSSINLPLGFTMDKFFIDIINYIEEQADWLFYMEQPSSNGASIGVPCFRHSRASDPPSPNMVEVRDTDLLESAKVTIDLSNLPYIIRYRGAVAQDGTTFDEEQIKRYNGTYFPPWSGAGPFETEPGRTSGVRRHEFTRNNLLQSDEECLFAAILAAKQYALQAFTAEIQISGYPGIELNQQISVVDKTTALNSRLWVTSIQTEHTTGPQGAYKMTVGGSLLDGMDMDQLNTDLKVWGEIVKDLRGAKEEVVGNLTF